MNEVIFETKNFIVEVPEKPFVDREDGGHLRVMSKLKVKDRTQLDFRQKLEYVLVTSLAGEALDKAMSRLGIEIGNVNWQEMGNWSVFKPEGITLHMHIFGRAKKAKVQKYGEAVQLPFRKTGFYDGFKKLNQIEIEAIKTEITKLLDSSQYDELRKFVVI